LILSIKSSFLQQQDTPENEKTIAGYRPWIITLDIIVFILLILACAKVLHSFKVEGVLPQHFPF
ncbi:MAG: hypothetical protein QMB59_02875, partial [Bacteroidales bacterium]